MRGSARVLATAGGALLLLTAAYHGSGIRQLGPLLADSSLPHGWVRAMGALWLFFSWHLLVVAVPPLWAAASGSRRFRPVLVFCGLVTLGDFLWVLSLAGWFPGTAMLLVAALGLLASGYLWRESVERSTKG